MNELRDERQEIWGNIWIVQVSAGLDDFVKTSVVEVWFLLHFLKELSMSSIIRFASCGRICRGRLRPERLSQMVFIINPTSVWNSGLQAGDFNRGSLG
jgi:hypothetical protein